MKLIISGAGGFLGKNLLEYLTKENQIVTQVIALTSNAKVIEPFQELDWLRVLSNKTFIENDLDLTDYTLINLSFARSSEFDIVKQSVEWTCNLLEKFRLEGGSKIINISSQSVYDPKRKVPASENDMVKLTTLYDFGKYYVEKWIEDFSSLYGLAFTNLRIASLVGPSFNQRITTRLMEEAIDKGRIKIQTSDVVFSYTHVFDIVRAILAIVTLGDSVNLDSKYNVGSEETYSIEDIAQEIKEILSRENFGMSVIKEHGNEVGSNAIDTSRFRQKTGWAPKYSLRDILVEVFTELVSRDNKY
jgi:nucleoside-diphosphate-sugar epimerase